MSSIDRRKFLQASAASVFFPRFNPPGKPGGLARVRESDNRVQVEGENYRWEWSQQDDRFRSLDRRGRVMMTGTLQPAVVVQPGGQKGVRLCVSGKPTAREVKDDRLSVTYEGVNRSAKLTVIWRFENQGFWVEPVVYETSATEDVVALHYFAEGAGGSAQPALEFNYLVLPGISSSSGVSPLVPAEVRLSMTAWLGRGATAEPRPSQQWGLPAHYFCGLNRNSATRRKSAMKEHLSDAFCCGLAELPNGDLFFETQAGRHSLIVSYRSDLWGHVRGPGRRALGTKLYFAVGPNYYEAIRQYYLGLVKAGIISRKSNSPEKEAAVVAPEFNTYGAQVATGTEWEHLNEAALISIYEGLKASGMKPRMFVIDADWEETYGSLQHSVDRLPNFQQIVARIRSEGYLLGLWSAFMRCHDPQELGLTTGQMLHLADGKPFMTRRGLNQFYILDFTQRDVQRVLRDRVKAFMQRYKPDLVKFDFGYELPSLGTGAPKDMNWAGERLLQKGLDVVVKAMREVNPDLVVMYYSLSPLLIDYFDLHSPDDLVPCAGDYALEANRRFFFSSLLGEIGMPTYGSGGYDWDTMPEIWFDSAAIGTLGSLNSFTGDEEDSLPTPERVAKFNGLAQVLRPSNVFTIEPVDASYFGPARGARSASWARLENGEVVLLALRKYRLDGSLGSGKFRDIASSDVSVVVASKTHQGISRAAKLAVVPYGDGELKVYRADRRASEAEVNEHCFGGGVKQTGIVIQEGVLRLPLRERGENGSPVEWVEVDIHPM